MGFIVGLVMRPENSVGRIYKVVGTNENDMCFFIFYFHCESLFASGQNIVLFFYRIFAGPL